MVKRLALLLVCTVLLAAASVWRSPADSREQAPSTWTNRAAGRFWTPGRMAGALPDTSSGVAEHFAGVPTVGGALQRRPGHARPPLHGQRRP